VAAGAHVDVYPQGKTDAQAHVHQADADALVPAGHPDEHADANHDPGGYYFPDVNRDVDSDADSDAGRDAERDQHQHVGSGRRR
jgi:hypothetical protein